jgi:hypothetical protein
VSESRSTDVKTWLRAEWDRVAGVVLVAIGALALVLGYRGVANSGYVAEQLAYVVSGGLGGLFCLGLGAVFLLRSDLHDHWRQLDRVEAAIRREPDPSIPLPEATAEHVPDFSGAGVALPPRSTRPLVAATVANGTTRRRRPTHTD